MQEKNKFKRKIYWLYQVEFGMQTLENLVKRMMYCLNYPFIVVPYDLGDLIDELLLNDHTP